MIRRWGTALAAVSALACASDAVHVEQAAVVLSRSPAEALGSGASLAVATALDDGAAREGALSVGAQVSLRVYGATVGRVAQPAGARALAAGATVTLDVHTAITQFDADGHATGRIENPFTGGPGRARLSRGRTVLMVVADDATDAAAWRVLEAYALNAAGDALAEPALGLAAGSSLDGVFASPSTP